jgi:protein gp37
MQETKIQWCDYSANLLKYRDASGKTAWACVKVSDGCKNCYAETLAHRYGRGGPYSLQQTRKVTPFFDEDEAKKVLRSKKLAGKRVFIDDMTDLFGEWVSDEIIDKHFALFALRQDVTFQVLTKRPERIVNWMDRYPTHLAVVYHDMAVANQRKWDQYPWPLPNVWLGTSCEDRPTADRRIPELLKCPAAVRFVSAEPLLGPVRLVPYLENTYRTRCPGSEAAEMPCLDWVIVGGESGSKARPCNVEWVRSIIRQCKAAGVAVFCKQLGRFIQWDGVQGGYLDGPSNCWPRHVVREEAPQGWRVLLEDGKGGDPDEWPEDLRVREMPSVSVPA